MPPSLTVPQTAFPAVATSPLAPGPAFPSDHGPRARPSARGGAPVLIPAWLAPSAPWHLPSPALTLLCMKCPALCRAAVLSVRNQLRARGWVPWGTGGDRPSAPPPAHPFNEVAGLTSASHGCLKDTGATSLCRAWGCGWESPPDAGPWASVLTPAVPLRRPGSSFLPVLGAVDSIPSLERDTRLQPGPRAAGCWLCVPAELRLVEPRDRPRTLQAHGATCSCCPWAERRCMAQPGSESWFGGCWLMRAWILAAGRPDVGEEPHGWGRATWVRSSEGLSVCAAGGAPLVLHSAQP